MSKRPEDFEDFSVDEIIAEIKSTTGGPLSPVVSEPSEEDIVDAIAREVCNARSPRQVKPIPEPEPEPVVAFQPKPRAAEPVAPPQEILETPPAAPAVPFGRRQKPQPLTPAQKILEDEAKLAREAARAQNAPWRTRPGKAVKAAPVEADEDTQEFEVILEAPGPDTGAIEPDLAAQGDERPGEVGYDFINQVYSDAQTAVRILDKRIAALSARILMIVPLLLAVTYMTLCLPRGWPMPPGFSYLQRPYLYLLVFALIHVICIALSAEVTAAGLMRLLRLRPTLDTLVLFGQLCILAHNVSVIIAPQWGGYLPFTCVGALTCLLALLSKRQRAEGLRRTYRASLMGTVPAAIKRLDEEGLRMAVKTETGAWVDMETIARLDPTERLGRIVAPIAMAATVGLALAASFGREQGGLFLWALAAIGAAGAPLSLVLSATLPAKWLGRKLMTSGSGLINSERTRRLAKCDVAVLRDGDIFPPGAVDISGMKVAQNYRLEAVLGCAAALTAEVGGGLARAFAEFSRQQYIPPLRAENLRFFESGGLSAQVDGHLVLLGSASFLMRMGVRVTEGVKLPSSLFIAIDGGFAGIFSIKYSVQSQAYAAFRLLRAGRITPLLATRDVNITQAYVEGRCELRAGSTEFPEMNSRIRLSEAALGGEGETLAFLSRDGFLPFAEAVLAAKRQRRATTFGQIIGILALVLGLLLMYFLASNFKVASAAPHYVMLFVLLWLVPCWVGSALFTRM